MLIFFFTARLDALGTSHVGGFRPFAAVKVDSMGRLTIVAVFLLEAPDGARLGASWSCPESLVPGSSREEMDIRGAGPTPAGTIADHSKAGTVFEPKPAQPNF